MPNIFVSKSTSLGAYTNSSSHTALATHSLAAASKNLKGSAKTAEVLARCSGTHAHCSSAVALLRESGAANPATAAPRRPVSSVRTGEAASYLSRFSFVYVIEFGVNGI